MVPRQYCRPLYNAVAIEKTQESVVMADSFILKKFETEVEDEKRIGKDI